MSKEGNVTLQRAFKKKILKTIFDFFFFIVKDKFIKKGWAPCNVFFFIEHSPLLTWDTS